MENMEDLVFKFKEHLQVLNRSPATVKAYLMHTALFLKSADMPDITQITTTMLETWIAGLYDHRTDDGKPYSIGTICL
jgi:hypothetical protein